MCGIAGIHNSGGTPASAEVLRAMIARVQYRGPDDQAVWVQGPTGFGHARLSIIDIAGGRQPMRAPDLRLTITYNGEIFNYVELREELQSAGHRFRTQSDTEVVLRMYAEFGEACVERFNGQWAFAIWDEARGTLFLSRDRLGVRPLFHAMTKEGFVFGSEMKALLAHPGVEAALDPLALDQVFTYWSALAPRTMLRGVSQLPPGHSMRVSEGKVAIWPYWNLDYSAVDPAAGDETCARRALELLDDATRLRLRADVPVGAYLSGGLDSSIISALARRHCGERLETFSVAFDDDEFDESGFQKDVVDLLGTRHTSIRCSYADICAAFPDVVWHAETPLLRTAPVPLFLLSRLVRERGCKVVLTGEGSDEFFGGYDIFKEAKIRRYWGRDPASRCRPLLLQRLYPYMKAMQAQPPAYLQAFFHVNATDLANPFFSHLPRWALTAQIKSFFSREFKSAVADGGGAQPFLPSRFADWTSFAKAEYLEATGLLPGYLLSSQGDRMAMAHSVEGRFPFLDHRVVDFATRMPPRLKMRGLREKYILKRAAAHLVPASVRSRVKQPYRAPDAKSFFDPSTRRARARYVDDLLDPGRLRAHGVFDPNAVGVLAEKARSGRAVSARDNMALVAVLSTELWIDRFIGSGGERPNGRH